MSFFESPIVVEIIKKLIAWFPFRRRIKVSEIMTDSLDVEAIAKEVLYEKGLCIDFFYLMLAYNGRRVNKGHIFKFRKIVSGDHTDWMFPAFDKTDHRRLPLDTEYSSLLEELIVKKIVSRDPQKMDETHLKEWFLYLKMKYIKYYYVDETREGVWYVQIATSAATENQFNSYEQNQEMYLAVSKIQHLIQKHKRKR